jgi:hypothetical protein
MVGTAAQIARDIAALEQAVTELADSFHGAYSSYLIALGQAIRSQLILACYHICTQAHPDRFLKLSYNQRQQLQKTLKYLAVQVQEELLACLLPPGVELLAEGEAVAVPPGTRTFSTDPTFSLEPSFFLPTMPPSSPAPVAMPSEQSIEQPTGQLTEQLATSDEGGAAEAPAAPPPMPKPITPILLSQWHRDLEQAIGEELRTASHAANRILQQAGILSKALPEPLLDMTASTEGADIGGNTPNVLSLLLSEGMGEFLSDRGSSARGNHGSSDRSERGTSDRPGRDRLHMDRSGPDEAKAPITIHVSAIHLRLAEIEFADAALTLARTKIRTLSAQMRNLGRDYQKKMQERAIAEAQAAWRSSWMED